MSSIIDVRAILQNHAPGYVPPVPWEKLGRIAYRQQLRPQASWPQQMRNGWIQTKKISIAAAAETSAYLVSIGSDGEL